VSGLERRWEKRKRLAVQQNLSERLGNLRRVGAKRQGQRSLRVGIEDQNALFFRCQSRSRIRDACCLTDAAFC
jgi:hypothetical protein